MTAALPLNLVAHIILFDFVQQSAFIWLQLMTHLQLPHTPVVLVDLNMDGAGGT